MANEVTTRVTPMSMEKMADAFYASGMFPDIRSQAQAIVKIQAGSELGFPPIYAMTKIYIVKGRVMVSAEALGAMIKRSGRYDYRVVKLTDTECELQFTDRGADAYLSRFTMEDAKRADLIKTDSGWMKWPRAMLMSKALSQGARIVGPETISGAYTPEDFGFTSDPETGDVADLPDNPAPTPKVTVEDAVRMEEAVSKAAETPVVTEMSQGDADSLFTTHQVELATPNQVKAVGAILKRLGDSAFWDMAHKQNILVITNLSRIDAGKLISAGNAIK